MNSLQSQKFFQQWRITWTKIWATLFLFALSAALLAPRHNFRTQAAGQTAPEHLAAIAYYSVKGDWDSILTLNNSANEAVNAAIVLYSLEGKRQKLPGVTINSHNNTSVRLNDLLANADDRGQFQEGSLEVHFNSTNGMAIAPQLTVTDAKHGLSFDMESPMHFKSARLESLWWSLDEKTDGQIMLCNTTMQNLDVKAAVEWHGGVLPAFTVSLSPHQMLVLEIEKLLKDLRIQSKALKAAASPLPIVERRAT